MFLDFLLMQSNVMHMTQSKDACAADVRAVRQTS